MEESISPVLINTAHENVHFWNQIKGNIHRSEFIDQKMITIINSVISVLKMHKNFYLGSWGLGIVKMNHINLQKQY